MKKLISAVLAAATLIAITGCDALPERSDPIPSKSDEELIIEQMEWILDCYECYYINYKSPEDGLPVIGGTNTRPSLRDVLSEDAAAGGELKSLLTEFAAEEGLERRFEITDKVLQRLCETDNIPEGDGLFSERKLLLLRTFWGENGAEDIPVPETSEQAALLERAYTALVQHYCLSLICSLAFDELNHINLYTDENGSEHLYTEYFNWDLYYGMKYEDMTELHFLDCCRAAAYYGQLKDKNLRIISDLRAYMEDQLYLSYEGDMIFTLTELIDRAVGEIKEVLGGVNSIDYILGGAGDDELVGGDIGEFIIGGSGNDILNGGAGDDHLHGGEGDDVYIIRRNCGDDVIFDCSGDNILRFENIPIENVYVSSVTDEGHSDDVKITFIGGGGSVTIRDFNSYRSYRRRFDLEFGAVRVAQDDPDSPFMYIDDESRLPETAMPPGRS